MGRKADLIRREIEKRLGETDVDVWYEPIHGPCMEKVGYAGGWFYSSDETSQTPLGYNVDEALEMIALLSRIHG